ncbi:MAG: dTDP-4-dehydrorhamnose 3,5-epimerase [Salinivirgaceae bacterium]|nr:dTDP-4-dehydrorhamnose 3,5-epimerase [Salinivirgaceae bacterium]
MKVIETNIPDVKIIEPRVFKDERGYFFESFNEQRFFEKVLKTSFVQDNESLSTKGVLRGLHYQMPPYAQSKLVRVIKGEVYDVAVDIRKGSPTFGQYTGVLLTERNKKQFFIPRGFAHGFVVLSEEAIFFYKCDNYYAPESERSINFDDPDLNIDWNIDLKKLMLSDKDKKGVSFKEADLFDFNTNLYE